MKCQPTAGLEPAVLGLEVPRLIHWATRAAAAAAAAAFVHGVGFEPTSANTVDLKSTPLDLSGNHACFFGVPSRARTGDLPLIRRML